MKEKLVYIRAKSDRVPPLSQRVVRVLWVFLLGALLGLSAKLIGTYPVFGVVVASIIAMRSRSPKVAALHVFVFLTTMIITYYIYSMVLLGFSPKDDLIYWGGIALLSPLAGYLVWYAKGNGWRAAFCAALPISMLLVKGNNFFYTFSVSSGLAVFAAVLLFSILPANHFQRLRMLPMVTLLFFLLEWLGVPF
ncbi:hypothetical protein J1P26_12440 [Neobacillus sp. MM2021_6]|uniref:hypothetical protein n=1 Tax=Bacillaceae TaxID=186817 RepID=UPI00140A2AA2|nr:MULTISPECIES: hypothetical protein [Bacillaceae]MBO0960504.1 hypothetical protein [Neobacillus sp. MM2021_6]NHC19663.1 hypothetical protein [Bacillus sp. MM2020_4]